MCIFKASYIGRGENPSLKVGEIYSVEKAIEKGNGKTMFVLEGISGEHEKTSFHKLERKGFHYLIAENVPKVGNCMRLVRNKRDIQEFVTGEVKIVEPCKIPGVYRAYTAKAIYEVSAIN